MGCGPAHRWQMGSCSTKLKGYWWWWWTVAHTAELGLTETEIRLAEGVQADAPVEQVAATVGLRVVAELHHMWASPCSVWSQRAHGAVQVRGSEAEFLGEGLPCF